jgi:hypothetical protein
MNVVQTLLIGLAAGAIATVIFTIVEYLDIALTGRPVSYVPGAVAVAMTGGDPHGDRDRDRVQKLNLPTHFAHGTALGLVLAALSLLGLSAVLTTIIFYVLLLGGDWMLYTVLGVTTPWSWTATQWARELVLKALFAAAMGVAFYWLIDLF